jgi:signal transduction histidine kinase
LGNLGQPPARSSERLLQTLEQLIKLPTLDLKASLSHASDLVAGATGADKVDVFLYERARDSLVATGSNQPLSALQRKHGLDVLQLANGGRVVYVFRTGETFINGRVDQDPEELKGIKETLGIKSKLGVPLEVAGVRRGMMMLASLTPEFFNDDDLRFAQSVVGWIGSVAHRAELVQEIGRNAMEQGRKAAAEELVTVLAHDLRNYIAPLRMRHYTLRRRAMAGERADDLADLDVADRALGRLMNLVTDILDVARLDQGVFRIDPRKLDVPALLEDIAGVLSTPDTPVSVRVQANAPLTVMADEPRLRQCVENLISNAIQKSPGGAEVTVIAMNETRESGEWVHVEVIDQGPGIPEDLLPHIFERFKTGKDREGGLGLGLYLAKRIAAVHGGDLTVESTPGRGARFRLTLPAG